MIHREFDEFSFLLLRMGHAQHSLVRKKINELGLHRGQPPVLFALNEKEGPSNSQLAEALHITPATMTNKIKRMERAGLVIRRRDPEDERVSRVYLTDKGRGKMSRLRRSMDEVDATLLKGFSEQETEQLEAMIIRIIENLEAEVGHSFEDRHGK
jgi:DNA-binding MarR family transcriptional regulator